VASVQTPFVSLQGFLSSEVNGWNIKLIIHFCVVDVEPRVVACTQKWHPILSVGVTQMAESALSNGGQIGVLSHTINLIVCRPNSLSAAYCR
jgi:hypothetical protein